MARLENQVSLMTGSTVSFVAMDECFGTTGTDMPIHISAHVMPEEVVVKKKKPPNFARFQNNFNRRGRK